MKLINYIKDKELSIFLIIILNVVVTLLLYAFDVNFILLIYIPLIITFTYILIFLYEFFRRNKFYNTTSVILNELDKKYLINEIITEPNFLEGKILYEYLYDIDKNYHEEINTYKNNNEDFKEYMELWCHEVKTPIATSKMILENNKSLISNSINEEITKIDNYIEQILYYARSEIVEKDYMIKKTNIKEIIDNVIKRNKKDLINNNTKIELDNLNVEVNSDSKWLEFIINQIINNSIKYSSKNPTIKISTKILKNNIHLDIEDNGIGIIESEIDKVFDKSFTGSNGRLKYNSTGIGLYLCKKLCLKLGHNIYIKSVLNEKTVVTITFPINSLTNLTNM